MAFARVGIDWCAQSDQDLYSRLGEEVRPRDVVKKAINIMMNAPRRSAAIFALNVQQRKNGFFFDNGMAPFKGWSSDLVSSIEDAYLELEDMFYAELGNHFMDKEGNICIAIVDWATRERVPVLTIHDSFICPASNAHELEQIIGVHFGGIVGARCLKTRNDFDLQHT